MRYRIFGDQPSHADADLRRSGELRQDEIWIWPQRVPSHRSDSSDAPHRKRSIMAKFYRPASATTLSASGVGSDNNPTRVMSSMDCSVMYFE
jgi:hypothetical protein